MLEYPGPILTYFTGLVGVLLGMVIQIFVWRSGDVRKRRVERPLPFALHSTTDWLIVNRFQNVQWQ